MSFLTISLKWSRLLGLGEDGEVCIAEGGELRLHLGGDQGLVEEEAEIHAELRLPCCDILVRQGMGE
jgi:hypothetical protein